MRLVKQFIEGFLSRSGNYIFLASIFSKILSFIASVVVLQFVSDEKLGVVLYAYNIILFILPLSGLGLSQSLIRFGSLASSLEEKKYIFTYVIRKGSFASLLMIAIVIGIALFFNFHIEQTYFYLCILSISILPTFLLESLKSQLRVLHDNKSFAWTELIQNVVLLVLVSALSYFFKELGYAIALVVTPLLTYLIFFRKIKFNFQMDLASDFPKINFSFFKYGFFASLSNVVTQLLFVIDILLLGYLLSDAEIITKYRYISLIPLSLLFLPRVFMAADFVAVTEKIRSIDFIKTYIKSYLLFFSTLSFILIIPAYFFQSEVLLLFGSDYSSFGDSFFLLMVGICGIFILRGLFGNLLSSLGKAHINYYIALAGLLINIALNYLLIPKLGLKGAAITSSLLMWFTGIISMFAFGLLYRNFLREADE